MKRPDDNYMLHVRGQRVDVTVYVRPDLSLEAGTASGHRMLARLEALFEAGVVRSQLWDMTNAPASGPTIQRALHAFFLRVIAVGITTAVVTAHPTQRMLYARILGDAAPCGGGAVFTHAGSARLFCHGARAGSLRGWVRPIGRSPG